MELSSKVVQVSSNLKPEEEEFPSFSPNDIILLFGDIAKPVGLVSNHNNPIECFVICPNSWVCAWHSQVSRYSQVDVHPHQPNCRQTDGGDNPHYSQTSGG